MQQGHYASFMVLNCSKEGISTAPPDSPKIMYRVLDNNIYWDYRAGRKKEIPQIIPECK